jgi:hypothetical protein
MFLKDLSETIAHESCERRPLITKRISNFDTVWQALADKTDRELVLDDKYWLEHWTEYPCDSKPTQEDRDFLKRASERTLDNYHFCLCTSLKALILNDMENLESTENLHQFHLIIKAEMLNRHIEGVNPMDSFLIDVANKKLGNLTNIEKLMIQARAEGVCPQCKTKEFVISYGDKWHCKLHKKYWRKT